MLICIGAALAACILASFGPAVLRRLPEPAKSEPAEPDDDKTPYADLAGKRLLGLWLGVAAAITAGLIAAVIDDAWFVPMWVALASAGALLAYIDWHTRLLPYLIVWPLNLVVLLLATLGAGLEHDWGLLGHAAIAGVVVWLIFRIMHQLFSTGLGYGDVRLSFALGIALGTIGTAATVWGLWLGFVLGAVGSIILSRLKIVDAKGFAFGPYLLLGTVLGAIGVPAIF